MWEMTCIFQPSPALGCLLNFCDCAGSLFCCTLLFKKKIIGVELLYDIVLASTLQ